LFEDKKRLFENTSIKSEQRESFIEVREKFFNGMQGIYSIYQRDGTPEVFNVIFVSRQKNVLIFSKENPDKLISDEYYLVNTFSIDDIVYYTKRTIFLSKGSQVKKATFKEILNL